MPHSTLFVLKMVINLHVYDNNILNLYFYSQLGDIMIKPKDGDRASLISYASMDPRMTSWSL